MLKTKRKDYLMYMIYIFHQIYRPGLMRFQDILTKWEYMDDLTYYKVLKDIYFLFKLLAMDIFIYIHLNIIISVSPHMLIHFQ